jgi:hypothetical protein
VPRNPSELQLEDQPTGSLPLPPEPTSSFILEPEPLTEEDLQPIPLDGEQLGPGEEGFAPSPDYAQGAADYAPAADYAQPPGEYPPGAGEYAAPADYAQPADYTQAAADYTQAADYAQPYAPPAEEEWVEGPVRSRELTAEETMILDELARMAAGDEAAATIVRPAQLLATLIRLLIRKQLVTEQELLDEILRGG